MGMFILWRIAAISQEDGLQAVFLELKDSSLSYYYDSFPFASHYTASLT